MILIHWLPTIFSIVSTLFAAFAGVKAHQAAKTAAGVYPSYSNVTPRNRKRLLGGMLFGAGPNDAAGPADIANKIDGIDGATGQALHYRLAAIGYEAHAFGLATDYAFPEAPNVTASLGDHGTTLAKLFGRKRTLVDQNQYDSWDLLLASGKAALRMYPDLMSDEPNSKNYKKPATPATGS